MPSDTDLDALMQAYRDLDDEKFHDTIEALRARLAPTRHADDEALPCETCGGTGDDPIDEICETCGGTGKQQHAGDADLVARLSQPPLFAEPADTQRRLLVAKEVSRRLAELRARAEKAERALAECRAKTIEECAAEGGYFGGDEVRAAIRELKTKEPT